MGTILASVIVPSYNSGLTIARCLQALQNQETAFSYEIVVVDSSNDGTPDLVRNWWHLHCTTSVMQGREAFNPTDEHATHEDGRVLIVEDESLSRKALAMLLGACGYETLSAGSAEEAISMMSSEGAPDFALVDVDLPGMSGLEFAERLNKSRPDVFTVLITAAEGERIESFIRQHPVMYIRKPLDFDHLLGVLSEVHAH